MIGKITRPMMKMIISGAESGSKAVEKGVSNVAQTIETKAASVDMPPSSSCLISRTNEVMANFVKNQQQIADKLEKKISTYFGMMPKGSKMKQPIILEFYDAKYEFFVDKTRDITCVRLKKIVNLDSDQAPKYVSEVPEVLTLEIDSSGKLIGGTYIDQYYEYASNMLEFTRSDKNVRRINYTKRYRKLTEAEITYAPSSNDKSWSVIKQNLYHAGSEFGDLSIGQKAEATAFERIFFNLAGLDKTL